ncbi:hypothetical protein OCV51_07215 [Faecalicatena acetigenes]|jgi:hypothetical protein|uniref:Uncharacterized protein n=1 Tax=Faecalicatena acetigenes TaxID=2981790 RepID=A0ABT2TAY8_9FIRM|nr:MULTISPECIES: hypothetical protein [Lachnospiraceae]MCU6747443.1 hypothetical protein [Faecalicatena acetigenes]
MSTAPVRQYRSSSSTIRRLCGVLSQEYCIIFDKAAQHKTFVRSYFYTKEDDVYANGKKLPSGSWRCQMFSHYEPIFDKSGKAVIDSKTGKQKQKHVYGLFTCDEPEQSDKQTAEVMAVQFDMYPLKMK